MSASCEGGFSLLALSQPALLEVFASLTEMRDSIALSLASKELWELGAASRRRALCCAACHHAVVPDAAAAFSSDTYREAPHLGLPDGDSHAFDAEHAELRIRGAGGPGHEVRVQHVQCGGCGLHLGVRLVQLGSLRAGAAAACIRHWRELQVLGACFLARRYLRLRAPDGREELLGRPLPPSARALYRCTAARSSLRRPGECGAALFEQRDVLSRQHCWDAGGGPERALYINGFRPGAVVERNERQESLCQGEMRVADVHCTACAARIGWRFCRDLTPALDNCNQVGRFGVVRSSIEKDEHAGT
ncbi:expressed protein [Chlorella variabilis]|uniref:Expressed protein n=1 Tax=Chlorella variabilis TaxID=554065 RepID=E1ZH42_CHLVA|nr:expressed protein [Chlorella variabilis]EFN55053.1 expressed protein [Chlorella variabilis]|eukprot:XP_005847155.1 expressed protein [Chlorella variabilis]